MSEVADQVNTWALCSDISLLSCMQQQIRLSSHPVCSLTHGSTEVNPPPISSQQEQLQTYGITDYFCGTKDGRVNPHRRPQFVDHLHFLFFLLSLPSLVTMLVLFITMYALSNIDAYTSLCAVSGVATFTALCMTGLLILCHLTAYTCPTQQRMICRIILIVPIYAMDSFIALMLYRIATIVALLRDTYEAYAIYQFYFLLMEYLGGEHNVLHLWSLYGTGKDGVDLQNNGDVILHSGTEDDQHSCTDCITVENVKGFTGNHQPHHEKKKEERDEQWHRVDINSRRGGSRVGDAATAATAVKNDHLKGGLEAPLLSELKPEKGKQQLCGVGKDSVHFISHLFPANLCFSPIPLNEHTLFLWKVFLTQYVILNPLLTLITIPMYFTGYYVDGSFSWQNAYPYLAIIRTVSVTLALTGLAYFYFATKAHMRVYSPTSKLLVIKAVVFLSYWQGVLLSVLVFHKIIPSTSLGSAKELASVLQNFIITLEMYVISIAHRWVFCDDIYLILSDGRRQKLQMWVIRHVISVSDVIDEASSVMRMAPRTAERMIKEHLARWSWSRSFRKKSESARNEDTATN